MTLKFIDLFAGIGGMRLAFEDAGAECVLTCEINQDALTTYKENFKGNSNHTYHNDILTLTVELQRKVSHYLQPILSHQFLNNLA